MLVSDSQGAGISGVVVTSELSQNCSNQGQTSSSIVNATTGSDGIAHIVQHLPDANYCASVQIGVPGPGPQGGPGQSFPIQPTPVGVAVPAGGNLNAIQVGVFSIQYEVQAFAEGPNGTAPNGLVLDYSVQSNIVPGGYLGIMDQIIQSFPLSLPSNMSGSDQVTVNMSTPGGLPLQSGQFQASQFGGGVQNGNTAVAEAYILVPGLVGFFIPLLSMLAAYSSYGRDRVSGVLEATLVRPVTKGGLITSRFVAVALAMAVAIGLSLIVLEIALGHVVGSYIPWTSLLAFFGALLVSALAFAGLVFFSSHLVKSTGVLVGIIIGLFLLFAFFGTFFVDALGLGLSGASPTAQLQAQVYTWYLNPTSFFYLIKFYLNPTFPSGLATNAAQFGVTIPYIVGAGLLWGLGGFVGAWYLARKRD